MTLSVCSYNLGAFKDFNPTGDVRTLQTQVKQAYLRREEGFATAIASTWENVFLLQGTKAVFTPESLSRPLIRSLTANYEVLGSRRHGLFTNTSVAINRKEFKDIENLSFQSKFNEHSDIACASAKHKTSGKSFLFVSASLPLDGKDEEASAYMKDLAQKIQNLGSFDVQMIGVDMRASPEQSPERFEVLKSAGFELNRLGSATTISGIESDFIFTKIETKKTLFERLQSLFVRTFTFQKPFFGDSVVDLKDNVSGHFPLFTRLNMEITPSTISRLWMSFVSCFNKR